MAEISKESIDRLAAIFMPYMTERVAEAKETKRRFVHYTTAENALNILRSKRMYLRNTLCMNDYRELTHGLDLLFEFFHNADSKRIFSEVMSSISPNLAEDGIALFDQWLPQHRYEIYVTCISEHLDEEDKIGRLSMWRAYSRPGTVGVAMVLNSEPFHLGSTDLHTFLSPVAYLRSGEFKGQLDRVLQNVRENADFLKSIPRPHLVHCYLHDSAICCRLA